MAPTKPSTKPKVAANKATKAKAKDALQKKQPPKTKRRPGRPATSDKPRRNQPQATDRSYLAKYQVQNRSREMLLDGDLVERPTQQDLLSDEKKRRWLEGYAKFGVKNDAHAYAGIAPSTFYLWTNPNYKVPRRLEYTGQYYDEDFATAVPIAYSQFQDLVEAEMRRRGIEGWEEPVFGKGVGRDAGTEIVGYIRKYSDRILELLGKKVNPEFREKVHEVVVNNNSNAFNSPTFDMGKLSPEQKRLMLKLLEFEAAEEPVVIEHKPDIEDANYVEIDQKSE
jgi:hypothetical protein